MGGVKVVEGRIVQEHDIRDHAQFGGLFGRLFRRTAAKGGTENRNKSQNGRNAFFFIMYRTFLLRGLRGKICGRCLRTV